MTTAPKKEYWEGAPLTPDLANDMDDVMARVYALMAWHCATRTRLTLTTLGEVEDMDNQPIGTAEARMVVGELHEMGLVVVPRFREVASDTAFAVRLSGVKPARRTPVEFRTGEGRVKVGGRFTAPRTMDPALLHELVSTGEGIARLHALPSSHHDAEWLLALAHLTERRAAAFQRWSAQDSARTLEMEAKRLAEAAVMIKDQAANRQAEDKRRTGNAS